MMKRTLFLMVLNLSLCLIASAQDKNQQLYRAITEKNVKQVAQLLRDSADANYVAGPFQLTMLNTAITVSRNKQIVELLLQHKADVNRKDAFNTTPLMYAASAGNIELVGLLLAYGADVQASDGQGNTVLSAAKESKNKALVKLIEKKLAEKN